MPLKSDTDEVITAGIGLDIGPGTDTNVVIIGLDIGFGIDIIAATIVRGTGVIIGGINANQPRPV